MASPVVANKNSYRTSAEATAYLADSIRAGAWVFVPAAKQAQSLISATRILEKQRWRGVNAALSITDTLAVNVGGTGYTAGDVLTVSGGTGVAARITVSTVAAGVITAVQLLDAGLYSVDPTSPVSVTGGTGADDATFTVTFKTQVLDWARTGTTDEYGDAVDPLAVPKPIGDAQLELAFELSQDADLETSGGIGDNEKRLKAGSAEIEFFRPSGGPDGTGSQRFSPHIQELLAPYLNLSSISAPTATGTDEESQFTDDKDSCLTQGLA